MYAGLHRCEKRGNKSVIWRKLAEMDEDLSYTTKVAVYPGNLVVVEGRESWESYIKTPVIMTSPRTTASRVNVVGSIKYPTKSDGNVVRTHAQSFPLLNEIVIPWIWDWVLKFIKHAQITFGSFLQIGVPDPFQESAIAQFRPALMSLSTQKFIETGSCRMAWMTNGRGWQMDVDLGSGVHHRGLNP